MADISLQSATEIAITDTTLIPAQPTGGVWSKITGLGIKTYLQSLFDAKVSTTGNETIAGIKTFSSSPIVPTPTTGTQASNKDYSDSTPDFYKYSIVTSVASGNLTVALKNYEGNDPTPTKPVKIQNQDGTIRTITSSCSATIASNDYYHFNAGSTELATKEIDYCVYIGTFGGPLISRKYHYRKMSDASGNGELTISNTGGFSGTDTFVPVGRFNAIKASGVTGNWSIPATSVIINNPIRESDWKDISPVITWTGTAPTGTPITTYKYKIVGDMCIVDYSAYSYTPGASITRVTASLPFSLSGVYSCAGFISTASSLNLSGGYFIASTAEINCSSVSAERFIIGGTYKI